MLQAVLFLLAEMIGAGIAQNGSDKTVRRDALAQKGARGRADFLAFEIFIDRLVNGQIPLRPKSGAILLENHANGFAEAQDHSAVSVIEVIGSAQRTLSINVADAFSDAPRTSLGSGPVAQRAPAFHLIPIRLVTWIKLQAGFATLQPSAAMLARNWSAPELFLAEEFGRNLA
jgi:hypothetical protein